MLLAEYPNLKTLTIRGFRRLSLKTFLKILKHAFNLKIIEIRDCLQIREDIISDFQNLYLKIKLIFIENKQE